MPTDELPDVPESLEKTAGLLVPIIINECFLFCFLLQENITIVNYSGLNLSCLKVPVYKNWLVL